MDVQSANIPSMEPHSNGQGYGFTVLNDEKGIKKKESLTVREEGRSLFPVSRVQRIIKADKDLPVVAKEAVFVISVAAEEFIKRISLASQRQADREKRSTVQKKDIAIVAKRADEFFFLEDILTWDQDEVQGKPKGKAVGNAPKGEGFAPLSRYMRSMNSHTSLGTSKRAVEDRDVNCP